MEEKVLVVFVAAAPVMGAGGVGYQDAALRLIGAKAHPNTKAIVHIDFDIC